MRNDNPIEVTINNENDGAGWYVEWYQEGIDGSETAAGEARGARWYGSREECERMAKGRAPRLRPLPRYTGQLDYTRNAHTSVGGEAE
jgi:hypothetical protein